MDYVKLMILDALAKPGNSRRFLAHQPSLISHHLRGGFVRPSENGFVPPCKVGVSVFCVVDGWGIN
jgi:hypothetical protein